MHTHEGAIRQINFWIGCIAKECKGRSSFLGTFSTHEAVFWMHIFDAVDFRPKDFTKSMAWRRDFGVGRLGSGCLDACRFRFFLSQFLSVILSSCNRTPFFPLFSLCHNTFPSFVTCLFLLRWARRGVCSDSAVVLEGFSRLFYSVLLISRC
jgi:hypothetical protein